MPQPLPGLAAATGVVSLLVALVFVAGERINPLAGIVRDRRSLVSLATGMSAAYVFVHLLPELAEARETFKEAVGERALFGGVAVYYLALVGFLLSYGLDRWRSAVGGRAAADAHDRAFRMHVGGFAAYAALITYLLARAPWDSWLNLTLYAVAIAGHFLAVDHELREEHGDAYRRRGRWLLAGASLGGWALGLLLVVPPIAISLMFALLSGAVIMTSAVMELSPEKQGRLAPFVAGGLGYGLLLVPLG